jgi:hypothetical protein
VDAWTFNAAVGDTIVLRAGELTDLGGTGGFTPAIRLLDPDGAVVGASAANLNAVEVVAVATKSGAFRAIVTDGGAYTNGLGSYRLHLAQPPAIPIVSPGDDGGVLTNGAGQLGTIHLGDLDVWTFRADVGDRIVLRAGEVTETGGTGGFTPAIRLYGPNGALVDTDAANLNAVEVTATATASGTFTAVVADGGAYIDGSGTYRLHLVRAPGEPAISPGDEGGALTNGATHVGTITAGDLDTWTFRANPGDNIVVRAGELTDNGGTGGFTPALRLFGPDGAPLAASAANLNVVEVAATATAGGVFTVVVGDGGAYIDGSGTYRLHLAQAPAEPVVSPGDEGGPLSNGATAQGTIHPGDLDVWTFTASAGDSIVVRAGELTDTGGTGGFTPALRLYGPDGALLKSDAANLNAVEVASVATRSGTYTVVVADGGAYIDGSGTYRLHLVRAPGEPAITPGDEGGPLTVGAGHAGTIHAGDLDAWTFTANSGDTIILRAGEVTDTGGTGGFTPALRLYGPDGTLVDSDAGNLNAVEVSTVAARSGLFTAVVGDGGAYIDGSGTYRLHLALMPEAFGVPDADQGGALLRNGARQGTIDSGDLDLWTFEANAGDNITVQVKELNDTGGTGDRFTPSIRVYNAVGAALGANSGATAATLSFRATESGLHVVVVGDGGAYIDGAGLYEITALGLPEQGRQLRIQKVDSTSVLVRWPAELADHVLQQNSKLDADGWVDVGAAPSNNGLNVSAFITGAEADRFFRLRTAK